MLYLLLSLLLNVINYILHLGMLMVWDLSEVSKKAAPGKLISLHLDIADALTRFIKESGGELQRYKKMIDAIVNKNDDANHKVLS